jgi:FkbM family methyltransferase
MGTLRSRLRGSVFRTLKDFIESTPLLPLAERVYRRYQYLVNERHPIQDTETTDEHILTSLGTEYGGWTFVDEENLDDSTIISAGLGEDISFEVEFADKYNSKLVCVDPTPRAIQHFEQVKNSIGESKTEQYVQGGKQPINSYELTNIDGSQLILIKEALWDKKTDIEFYKPKIESHVSHSITNWQHDYSSDTDYIEVQANTITSVINKQNIDRSEIPLIKLDIEGAEIEVISQMMDEGFKPKQILVEFDELHSPSKKALRRVDKTHELLLDNGYEIQYSDGMADFLYYRKDD